MIIQAFKDLEQQFSLNREGVGTAISMPPGDKGVQDTCGIHVLFSLSKSQRKGMLAGPAVRGQRALRDAQG